MAVTSCASAAISMVVKPPLKNQCQSLPIRDCRELVDGVVLYVQGDKPEALEKIHKAKDQNAPAQLKPFAKSLRDTASLPSAEDFASTLNEVADLLDPSSLSAIASPVTARARAARSAEAASDASDVEEVERTLNSRSQATSKPVPAALDPVTRALSATADFARIATETIDLSATNGRTPCKVAGLDALCVKAREGVIVVTDVVAGRSCPDRVFVGATLSDSPAFGFHWWLEAGWTPLTGGRLSVGPQEWLQIAIVPGKKGPSNSPECFVTWSGFRPWIVPGAADPGF